MNFIKDTFDFDVAVYIRFSFKFKVLAYHEKLITSKHVY